MRHYFYLEWCRNSRLLRRCTRQPDVIVSILLPDYPTTSHPIPDLQPLMMVPVSRLPDLCLLALFRQMTLQDQIGARKVCHRWADLVPEATSKRRKLILLIGENSIEMFERQIDWALFYERQALKLLLNADGSKMYPTRRLTFWNSLHVDSLDQATAKAIASTFTVANKLQVTHNAVSSTQDNLGHLLNLWSGQLVTLQLFENDKWLINSQTTTRLFAAINAQSALKHLHLHLNYMPAVPDLSIVSQLEELRFYSNHTTSEEFVQWLQQYGEGNRNLARIEYHDPSHEWRLEPFTGLGEHLRRCFTRLSFYNASIRDTASICAHFSGLTSLKLYPFRITVRQLFSHLATLHQLLHLYLTIDSDSFSADNQEQHLLLPQVKSVKALDLVLFSGMPIHKQFSKMKLAWTLPNVEAIRFQFDHFKCTECKIGHYLLPSDAVKSCLRKLFAPLKRDCTKLRLIEHDEESVHGTAEELLAQ